jgi:hypothetical protein
MRGAVHERAERKAASGLQGRPTYPSGEGLR